MNASTSLKNSSDPRYIVVAMVAIVANLLATIFRELLRAFIRRLKKRKRKLVPGKPFADNNKAQNQYPCFGLEPQEVNPRAINRQSLENLCS
jgi:ribosomal protein L11 methylase PrmA